MNFITIRNLQHNWNILWQWIRNYEPFIAIIHFHQTDRFPSQLRYFTALRNFQHNGVFSTKFWIFIAMNSFHQKWILITLIKSHWWNLMILMNFHHSVTFSSQQWFFIMMMNFIKMILSCHNEEFHIIDNLSSKIMNVHPMMNLQDNNWFFITIMNFQHNHQFSS